MSGLQRLNERQQRMLAILEQTGDVRVPDLKAQFGVTEMTIRRDLEKLEQTGKVKRTFGGAIMVTRDVAFSDRTGVRAAEKTRIGRCAAESIQPGDAVFLDGGTTTLQIVRHLPAEMRITVVTNAINLAAELMDKKIPTLVSGGMLLDTTSTLIGPVCVEALSKMAFDRIFLGTTGMTALHGFSNSNMYEAEIKRVAVSRAKEVNIVADRSKWGVQDLFSFAELSRADRLFTDAPEGEEDELRQALEEASVEWVVCD
ncbi:DeoR/GlpR family DNA-binding transcription regulator [Cohnella sp. REN36]|uniref:DeoR/GlpR family DNA-binding transcription regulator n=1 Tax=Cohnella sp. REN36 TaxID=2887347 RepID=UPI001D156BFC|nr:DeoR/GlpR family DNA-binding transcription regulator [Cohnella sp. REN36]MCC3375041.1 DeoR/GlpR family DNA-binding transcription regulator [Cohnella sp. REN36]